MFTTTSKLVKLAEKMNKACEEIDVALAPGVRADDVLHGPLHNSLDNIGRMLRPLR
jgi:hypothetical protein